MFGVAGSSLGNFISKGGFFIISATIHQGDSFLFAKLMLLIDLLHVVTHRPVFQADSSFSSPTLTLFAFSHIFFKELYIFHLIVLANFQFTMSCL